MCENVANVFTRIVAKVLHPDRASASDGASARLAASGNTDVVGSWQDINQLKCFVLGFPSDACSTYT